MQTPPLLILFGWSTRTKVYPSISSRSLGVEEYRYVSNEHMKSCLYTDIYPFNCVLRNYEQVNYHNFKGRLRVNFSLIFLDLDLIQYPHSIVIEQVYIKAL